MPAFLQALKIAILKYISGAAFKSALEVLLKSLIKSTTFGGLKGWFLRLFIKEVIIERGAEPSVKKAFRELGYVSYKIKGGIQWKKLNEHEENNDHDGYNDSVDDIMR